MGARELQAYQRLSLANGLVLDSKSQAPLKVKACLSPSCRVADLPVMKRASSSTGSDYWEGMLG
jgi:hypothetical protein